LIQELSGNYDWLNNKKKKMGKHKKNVRNESKKKKYDIKYTSNEIDKCVFFNGLNLLCHKDGTSLHIPQYISETAFKYFEKKFNLNEFNNDVLNRVSKSNTIDFNCPKKFSKVINELDIIFKSLSKLSFIDLTKLIVSNNHNYEESLIKYPKISKVVDLKLFFKWSYIFMECFFLYFGIYGLCPFIMYKNFDLNYSNVLDAVFFKFIKVSWKSKFDKTSLKDKYFSCRAINILNEISHKIMS
jgi:hypothetical protein